MNLINWIEYPNTKASEIINALRTHPRSTASGISIRLALGCTPLSWFRWQHDKSTMSLTYRIRAETLWYTLEKGGDDLQEWIETTACHKRKKGRPFESTPEERRAQMIKDNERILAARRADRGHA